MSANHARSWQSYNQVEPQTAPKRELNKVRVKKQGWITRGEKVIYSVIGLFFILAGIYLVSFSVSNDALNRDIQSLENKVQEQQLQNESLSFEVRELKRPERITRIAKENGLKIQDAEIKQASKYTN
ncbi:cell division protein FtsL [Oceanobacillus halotolerans]|uniref:cell division protein FtsL n=1 Tax=Oceanobacillus halotolerans TaxID=2663380 RepID=UPI0013DA149E|nr:cell division protein FtsL [Oceanobacillus halotolerans]